MWLKYRREIDGLRTVAVVPVILHHAHLSPFAGGFVGVDIFFVISGYLITALLIRDLEADQFSIKTFYERRARRILPALFFVMAATAPFALLWMFPLELNDFVKSIVATTVFSSNILFWMESGYFAPQAELKPLLHTWSLAVEEQYYIGFPLLLAVLWRASNRWITIGLMFFALTLASFACAMMFVRDHPDAVFYLLPFRAWELLAGSFAAIALHRRKIAPNSGLSALGLAMIVCGLVFASDELWPSYIALLPVFGTTLIILFASPSQGVGRILSVPILVGIGLISYSSYLWHQPILAFLSLRSIQEPSITINLAAVAATFVLATLTWRFVERPFRTYHNGAPLVSKTAIAVGSTALGMVFIVSALLIDLTDGLPGRTAPSGLLFTKIEQDLTGSRTDRLPCDTDIAFKPIPQKPLPTCIFEGEQTGPFYGQEAILIGDSHGTVLSGSIRNMLVNEGYGVSVMTFGGCPPFLGYVLPERNCNAANEAAYQHLETSGYDLVIIASRAQLLTSEEFRDSFLTNITDVYITDPGLVAFESGLRRLSELDAKIIYFDPVPEMPLDVGLIARKNAAFSVDASITNYSIPYAKYVEKAGPLLKVLDELEGDKFKRVVVPQLLCDGPNDACQAVIRGVSYYTDDNHLNSIGIAKLLPTLRSLLTEN